MQNKNLFNLLHTDTYFSSHNSINIFIFKIRILKNIFFQHNPTIFILKIIILIIKSSPDIVVYHTQKLFSYYNLAIVFILRIRILKTVQNGTLFVFVFVFYTSLLLVQLIFFIPRIRILKMI